MATRGKGRAPGEPQAHRRIAYDPSTGANWRTGISMQPALAVKAIKAADLSGLSVAGLLHELIRRMPVDKDGKPIWDAPMETRGNTAHAPQELPLAG